MVRHLSIIDFGKLVITVSLCTSFMSRRALTGKYVRNECSDRHDGTAMKVMCDCCRLTPRRLPCCWRNGSILPLQEENAGKRDSVVPVCLSNVECRILL